VSGWMADEGICRFYPVFRLLFRPFVSRLQMRFDARYIRQASRRHGGLGLLACIERTVSRGYARYKKKLFCSWSCNRPNHVLYYFMWGYEMTFKKKSAATVKVSGPGLLTILLKSIANTDTDMG
jgi:hypothetical protein